MRVITMTMAGELMCGLPAELIKYIIEIVGYPGWYSAAVCKNWFVVYYQCVAIKSFKGVRFTDYKRKMLSRWLSYIVTHFERNVQTIFPNSLVLQGYAMRVAFRTTTENQNPTNQLLSRAFESVLVDENESLLREIIKDRRVNISDDVIRIAMSCSSPSIVKELAKDSRMSPVNASRILITSARKGWEDVVQHLMNAKLFSPDATHLALMQACRHRNAGTVKILLESGVDPGRNNNELLCESVELGYDDIVRLLLRVSTVNPSVFDNYPICIACEKGHATVVSVLLEDERVMPNADDNFPLRIACIKGYLTVIEMLLKDQRVDPRVALLPSCWRKRSIVLDMILQDHRMDKESIEKAWKEIKQVSYINFAEILDKLQSKLSDSEKRVECQRESKRRKH